MAARANPSQRPSLTLDAGYTQAFDYDGNNNVIYQGWAEPSIAVKANAVWRIAKLTYNVSNLVTDITWADGNEAFDNIWNDRAGLSYQ